MKYTSARVEIAPSLVLCEVCDTPITGLAVLTNSGWVHEDCNIVGVAFR